MTFTQYACGGARALSLAVAVALLAAGAAAVDEPKKDDKEKGNEKSAVVTPTRVPGNVFGDEVSEFTFRLDTPRPIKGRIVWRVAAGTATVKTGEVEVAADAGKPSEFTIKIAVPPVKDGVIFHTRLTLSAVEDKELKPVATFERDLWVFPKDPFADRLEWLKKLKLTLYDPKGDTAKVFTAARVPFEEARDLDAVAAVKEGVLVVGEGLSFKDEKGLAAALHKLATGGLTVLVLAPAGGAVSIPGVVEPAAGLDELCFRRDIVRKLDKRLDPDGWAPDGKAVASSVVVKSGDDGASEVVPGGAGWSWVEARAPTGKGRWALCGLGIVAKWEAGPTPRFLFARLLEHVTDSEPEQTKKENE